MKTKDLMKGFCLTAVLCFCVNGLNAQSIKEQNVVTVAPASVDALKMLDGIWAGSAYQYDINESWNMVLTCDAEKDEVQIEYPSLSCGGYLTLISATENTITLREKITFGSSCIDNLIIELIRTGNDELDYQCHYENSTNIIGKGKLTKQPDGIPAWKVLNGTWTGSAYQYNINDSWDMTLTCDAEKKEITIAYPSLSCGGTLTLLNWTDTTISLRENITYGSCLNKLVIDLIQTGDNQLDYQCHYENSTTIIAQGKLTKQ